MKTNNKYFAIRIKRMGQFFEPGKDKATQRKEFHSFRKRAIEHIDEHKKYDTREEAEKDLALIMETGDFETGDFVVSELMDLSFGIAGF